MNQRAGRDAAGRDIVNNVVYNVRNFLSGSSDEARYWSERSIEQRRRFAARVAIEYSERLAQVLGPASGYPRAELRTAPDAVPDPLRFLPFPRQAPPAAVPPDIPVVQLYRQKQSLLVLGEPGAGKTTLLLELATQMLSGKDASGQVPIIVPLSTWERRKRRMRKGPPSGQLVWWLAELFEELYKVPAWLGARWLMDGDLVPLLDGLDEIEDHGERSAFMVAMNEYVSRYSPNVVLSCRLAEYESAEVKAKLESALVIQPLEVDNVLEFVRQQGETYDGLAEALANDSDMLRLCTSPLFFSMLMVTYPHQPAEEGRPHDAELNTRARLLRAYVDERFKEASLQGTPGSAPFIGSNTRRSMEWLSWLSRNLAKQSQADFLLERMRPSWLPVTGEIIARACFIFPFWFFCALFGLERGNPGKLLGAAYVVMGAWFAFISVPQSWNLHWSWRTALIRWRSSLAISIGGMLVGLVIVWLKVAASTDEFMIWPFGFTLEKYLTGVVIGALFGEVIGIVLVGFTGTVAESKHGPYESMLLSLWTGTWVFILSGITTFLAVFGTYKIAGTEGALIKTAPYLVFDLGNSAWDQAIHLSLLTAFIAAYMLGWGSVLAHMILRFWIWVWGVGPGPCVRWLSAMVELRLMYRSGAGFVFMHRILQEYFQSLPSHE